MKDKPLRHRWVVNVDQRGSRRSADRVPAALAVLDRVPGLLLGFERTAGDEIQGLIGESAGVVATVVELARLEGAARGPGSGWRIGIGLGVVEDETVTSTREARGPAYVTAREAVERAGRAVGGIALVAADPGRGEAADRAETALVLLRGVLGQRSAKGWEVIDLLEGRGGRRPAKQSEVAARLGISESAVSQRLDRAGWQEGARAARLAEHLLDLTERGAG